MIPTSYKDTYKTITDKVEEILFKDKNSKFYGYAYPVSTEEEIKNHLDQLKKEHFTARHWCYAYQIGTETIKYRANDDGEPNNSAGMPIYGQILSNEITNVLVVVVRYFGGVKLGVPGLINAYRTCAQLTLEEANIIEKTITCSAILAFTYPQMNKAMRIIKEQNFEIEKQSFEETCEIIISFPKINLDKVTNYFTQVHDISFKIVEI